MLPPLMQTINEQTGITLPEWQFGRLNNQAAEVEKNKEIAKTNGQDSLAPPRCCIRLHSRVIRLSFVSVLFFGTVLVFAIPWENSVISGLGGANWRY